MVWPPWEEYDSVFKVNFQLPHDLPVAILDIYPTEIEINAQDVYRYL